MADHCSDEGKPKPEPGSPADLLPEGEAERETEKDIRDKGEPAGGGNFA